MRDGFRSRHGFILACIGSAVGMGNIWRFPIMVSKYGGLTFLLPYVLFVVLIASTGVIEEFALGRRAGSGPVGAFGMCTEERFGSRRIGQAVGLLPVFGALMLAVGYTVVLGWIFRYVWMSLTGGLFALGQDMAAIGGTFGATAPENPSLLAGAGEMLRSGLFGLGNGFWQMIGLAAALGIMIFGIGRGIEKANRIMMPILFFLFVVLAGYIFFLPGAKAGYDYILTLTPSGLLDPEVWVYAFGQAFFSLSVAGNGSVIYGSYLSRDEDLPSSARNVAVFDTLAALLAMTVILPAMAAGHVTPDTAGPGLMFVYLPNVFNGMTGGLFVGILFFVCVLFAGLTSIINLYEVPVAFLQDRLRVRRLPAVLLIGGLGAVLSLLIQPWTSQWMDLVSIYICPLGALLAGIMFFWILRRGTAMAAVNEGHSGRPLGGWFHPLGRYVYCALALAALVAGILYGGIG